MFSLYKKCYILNAIVAIFQLDISDDKKSIFFIINSFRYFIFINVFSILQFSLIFFINNTFISFVKRIRNNYILTFKGVS